MSDFALDFVKKSVTNEKITIEDSANVANEALSYIDSILFFVGIPDSQDLKNVDSESLHHYLQGVSRLLADLNLVVWTQVDRLERERKNIVKEVEFINS